MPPYHTGDKNDGAQHKTNLSGCYTEDVVVLISTGQVADTRYENEEEGGVTSQSRSDVKVENSLHRSHDLLIGHNHKDEVLRDSKEEQRNEGGKGEEL